MSLGHLYKEYPSPVPPVDEREILKYIVRDWQTASREKLMQGRATWNAMQPMVQSHGGYAQWRQYVIDTVDGQAPIDADTVYTKTFKLGNFVYYLRLNTYGVLAAVGATVVTGILVANFIKRISNVTNT